MSLVLITHVYQVHVAFFDLQDAESVLDVLLQPFSLKEPHITLFFIYGLH